MAKASLDMVKLDRSIRKFSRMFGDTTEQATIRWGVQAARELAVVTAPFGGRGGGRYSARGTKDISVRAIFADALNVVFAVESMTRTPSGWKIQNQGKTWYAPDRKVLKTAQEINEWIGINRTRRRRRTAKLQAEDKRVCLRKTLDEAVALRAKSVGAAKGGWLDAGKGLAKKQNGARQISIGKSFLGYAQKASAGGSAQVIPKRTIFAPIATLTNNAPHVSDSNVLSQAQAKKAINDALPNTINWYRNALKPRKTP